MNATQPQLVSVPARYATVNAIAVRARLEKDDAEIADLIACGRLTVWNIATQRGDKRELRFLWEDLKVGIQNPESRIPIPSEFFDKDAHWFAGYLFGGVKPFVDGTDFRRAFNCDSKHVLNLIRAQVLAVLPNTGWHKGRNGTPAITWASAAAFVEQRRQPEWIVR